MPSHPSAWENLARRINTAFELPSLEEIVLPNGALLRPLLTERLDWLVAPPKCGKSVLSYYIAYLLTLGSDESTQQIISFDGAAECARGVDLVLEAPYSHGVEVAIFENPFGVEVARPNPIFIAQ